MNANKKSRANLKFCHKNSSPRDLYQLLYNLQAATYAKLPKIRQVNLVHKSSTHEQSLRVKLKRNVIFLSLIKIRVSEA